jgi:hypothetical protein
MLANTCEKASATRKAMTEQVKSPDFVEYHREILPALLEHGRGELLGGQHLPVLGLSVVGTDESFSYTLGEQGLGIGCGIDNADVSIALEEKDWRGLVDDLETVPGILYGGRLAGHTGNLMDFVRWEPALRALYTGRPIYDAEHFELTDEHGDALDPLSAFSLASDDGQMRAFLDAAGYLLVTSVFTEPEVARFRAAAAELAAAAVEGDQSSWWGKSGNGDSVLCRCLKAGTHPTFSGLYDDPRMRRLAALLPEGMIHLPPQEQDAITAIYKNPGVTEGLSDLPWHRDCGMGGHASMCPTYVLSIYLYDATPAAGQLQFLPGSQDFGFGFADASQVKYGKAVTVPACAGDITLHIGDVMHAAPPPEGSEAPFRQSILLAFQPDFIHHRGERHYNDALLGAEDGQVPHLRRIVKK